MRPTPIATQRAVQAALLIATAILVFAEMASAAGAKTLKVINATRKTMVEVYLTPLACNDDDDDALGAQVIEPGASRSIEMPNRCGCRYNLRFVFADKSTIDRFDIDICRRPSYRVTNH